MRFILHGSRYDAISEVRCEWHVTTTSEAECERLLRDGGHGPSGHLSYSLVGVELLSEPAPSPEPAEEEGK